MLLLQTPLTLAASAASPAHPHAQIQEPFVRVPGATQVLEAPR
jgi:hypothetical protein